MKYLYALVLVVCCSSVSLVGQQATEEKKKQYPFEFKGDFRFRIEQDWDSRKGDGSYRDDRSRLRYRLRFGFDKKINEYYTAGASIRSGNLNDQQGPHLTIGGGAGSEFGLGGVGIEKAFLKYSKGPLTAWIGKNGYPFFKQHELFWNDNVRPEGFAISRKDKLSNRVKLTPTAGYFLFKSYVLTI